MSFQTQSPTQTNLNLKFLLEEIKILTQENSRLARDNKELATRILELKEKHYVQCRELLLRIFSMLVKMAQGTYQIQSGKGTHTSTKLVTP